MSTVRCELCGSNDIVKQGDYYVCQHCGLKYTLEDAEKMIGASENNSAESVQSGAAKVPEKTGQKKWIAIGIACLAVIIAFSLLFGGKAKTPFDGIMDHPDKATVIKRYGNNYSESFGELNVDYNWCNTNGRLTISFKDGKAVRANWHYGAFEDLKAKVIEALDDRFGDHKQDGNDCVWHDKSGNVYRVELRSWGLHVYFNP